MLTVVKKSNNRSKNGTIYWICKCECGTIKEILSTNLVRNLKSCGCKNGNTKHGLRKHKLYKVWLDMKARCTKSNRIEYKHYGGRGISVCDEWLNNPKLFIEWALNNGYEKELTIDRVDNNGNYEPSNCRFVNRSVQNSNKRYTNKFGINYISKNNKGFMVRKVIDGKRKYFGTFNTLEEAKNIVDNIEGENNGRI